MGRDIKEVHGNKDEVILHKSLDCDFNDSIVEDTILEVFENNDWQEIVDIRWKINELGDRGSIPVRWIVSLGHRLDDEIKVYRGIIEGTLQNGSGEGFGFDSYFIPKGIDKSLYDLERIGQKDLFSARVLAIKALSEGNHILKIQIENIQKWTGKYQN